VIGLECSRKEYLWGFSSITGFKMEGMIPVASSEGVTVYCPGGGRYAFFNSPYPAHRLSTGVDIYPGVGFGDVAVSPVYGEVVQIRRVKAPRGRNFEDHGCDVVTMLRSVENPGRVIKILHVEPAVGCSDVVEPGQGLGALIRSGYFGFSTAPHIHVEVRPPSDPLRVRGGFRLRRILEIGRPEPLDELRGVVVRCTPNYSVVKLEGVSAYGVPCTVGGVPGLLDGGVPYYGWLGVHLGSEKPKDEIVELCGRPIAKVKSLRGNTCIAECTDFSFKLHGVPIGLSLYLYIRAEPEVLLIPRRPGSLELKTSSEITIDLE
jgi:hypothetical protein